MSKVPFVIIGILLITAVFIVIFTRVDEIDPLEALKDTTTPTPSMNLNLSGNEDRPAQQGNPQQQQQQQQIPPTSTPGPTVPPTQVISAGTAVITTNKGTISIQLYPEDAPKTVQNFATLASIGYYNGLLFHRVVPGFVIQGGDPNGNGTGGYSIYGPTFEDELNPETESYKEGYKEGVVAMANRGPNTNGSQFFIMLADNATLPHNYTIFGKVTEGMDVVKQIVQGDKMTSIIVQ